MRTPQLPNDTCSTAQPLPMLTSIDSKAAGPKVACNCTCSSKRHSAGGEGTGNCTGVRAMLIQSHRPSVRLT
jgi:hypothetical protein